MKKEKKPGPSVAGRFPALTVLAACMALCVLAAAAVWAYSYSLTRAAEQEGYAAGYEDGYAAGYDLAA